MATDGCEQTSDELFNFKCTPCSKVNKQREAVKYCIECQGYCCQSCVDMHNAFPALAEHRMVDKSTGVTPHFPEVPTELCSVHKIRIVDMYCGAHDEVGCANCIALEHRSCKHVKLVSDIVGTLFKITDADELKQKLQHIETTLEKTKSSKAALLQELDESKQSAVTAIKSFRKEIEAILQNLEDESLQEVDKEYQRMKVVLQEEMMTLENQIGNIKQATDDLKQSDENKAQQFVSIKTAEKKIRQTEDVMKQKDAFVHAKVEFQADKSVLEFLRQLKTFGLVVRNTVYKVQGTREMNIKIQSDQSTCSVYGSCLTKDGKLLQADYSNKKLKRADTVKLSVVDHCNLQFCPYDVCCIDNQEAVVTSNRCSIQFVTLGNRMASAREIKLNHNCLCIEYNDNKLYISDNSKSIYVHDMTYILLQTISKDSSGNDIFQCSRHISFSNSGDMIFVADMKNGVVVLDGQGNFCNIISDSGLNGATGVCSDRRGNLFVCGYRSNNVLQLGQRGDKTGTVSKSSDALNNPWSLTYDAQQGTLCLTQYNRDTVKLFDLI